MDAEIITTGTEILLGEIVDTNAAWMARRLRDLGINLFYKTTVGDNLERITAAMRQGLERSDLVLVTGGLGPTVDDMTRDAAALATDRELVLNDACLASIEAIFARWGRKVTITIAARPTCPLDLSRFSTRWALHLALSSKPIVRAANPRCSFACPACRAR